MFENIFLLLFKIMLFEELYLLKTFFPQKKVKIYGRGTKLRQGSAFARLPKL